MVPRDNLFQDGNHATCRTSGRETQEPLKVSLRPTKDWISHEPVRLFHDELEKCKRHGCRSSSCMTAYGLVLSAVQDEFHRIPADVPLLQH
jgi:hypothetical protein